MTTMSRRTFLGAAAALAALPGRARAADPPFGLGAVTYNVAKDWDLATLLRILQDTDMRAVEFRTTHAHGVEPALPSAARRDVKARCRDAGLRQISLGSTCEFHSPDPAVVQEQIDTCAAFVSLARDIGAVGVKVRPNGLPADVPVEKTLEQIGGALRRCGELAADQGVEIWVEVHGRGTQEPAHMRRIMDHCGHASVGINWNSNPTDVAGGSVRAAFDLLAPFLMSVHINQLDSGYPYRELFALLRQSNFERYTLIEVGTPMSPERGREFYQAYRDQWRELVG